MSGRSTGHGKVSTTRTEGKKTGTPRENRESAVGDSTKLSFPDLTLVRVIIAPLGKGSGFT